MVRDLLSNIRDAVELENHEPLFRFLDTNGDGTGTKNANGNYSVTPQIFSLAPGVNEVFIVNRLIVHLRSTGILRAEDYGSITSGLTNGVVVRVQDTTGTRINMTDGVPVRTNAGWARFAFDSTPINFGAGDNYIAVRWRVHDGGSPIRLTGNSSDRLEVFLNDDLSSLVEHYFFAHGYRKV